MQKQFIISTKHNQFLLTCNMKSNYLYITYGNFDKECIELFLYNNSTIAKMPSFDYHKQCNLKNDLLNGSGTRDLMISFCYALKTIFKNKILYIHLDDYSNITCDNGIKVNLATYNFAFYNKTFYERHFSAELVSNHLLYQQKKLLMNDENYKKNSKWFLNLIQKYNLPDLKLQEMYESVNTYNEFFKKLVDYYSKNELCHVVQDWIQEFISGEIFNLSCLTWSIDMEKYNSNDFIEIKNVKK